MPANQQEHTGTRIAHHRKLRHLTQTALAQRANISYSLLMKIERGHRQATPTVTAALARALSVSVTDLTGQPFLAELEQDQLHELIQPIRESLDVYDLGPDPDVRPRSPHAISDDAERLCALVRATDLKQVAAELPALITEATTAAALAPSDRAWSTLASTYRTAYDVATKLGFQDLSAIALDRMAWAAERASDPLVGAIRQYLRALAYLRSGEYRTGRRLVAVGQSIAAQAEPSRVRDVVNGQIHLGGAVLAARSKDGDAAELHLMEAQRFAALTGEAARVHWLSFGPFNVAAHRVSVYTDQDEYAKALTAAKSVTMPEDWPASRAAHHKAEIARAQLWTGRADAAFRSLQDARNLAPQQVRYSASVRDTVAGLVAAKRAAPDTLANYAHWVGM